MGLFRDGDDACFLDSQENNQRVGFFFVIVFSLPSLSAAVCNWEYSPLENFSGINSLPLKGNWLPVICVTNRVDVLWSVSCRMAACILQLLGRMAQVILSILCEINLLSNT